MYHLFLQICSNPTYSGTHAFLTHLCPAFGIEYTLLPPEASVKDYEDNIKNNTKVWILASLKLTLRPSLFTCNYIYSLKLGDDNMG